MKRNKFVRERLVGSFTKNGERETGEKIFKKSVKMLQRSVRKNSVDVIRLVVTDLAPAFVLRKSRSGKNSPMFVKDGHSRAGLALKSLKASSNHRKTHLSFYERWTEEVTKVLFLKDSTRTNQKDDSQEWITKSKRYFSKFRW